MRTKQLVMILVLLAAGLLPSPAHAGGVIAVCDEAHLLAALAGGGTVTFACSGTITLTDTATIDVDTTIDGSGHSITISGDYGVRLMDVTAGVTLSLNRLTIANGGCDPGCHGGGIRNNGGTVTVSTCAFHGNTAHFDVGGAIWNSREGILTISDSTFSNNEANRGAGGAIFNNGGTVTVSGSWFHDNSGGGAIATWGGVLAVNNSTFDHNHAEGGGGIHNLRGIATVGNSTFSNNVTNRSSGSTGAGIYNGEGGALNIWNSTFSGNWAGYGGGGGNAGGTVLVSNSTFHGNRSLHGGGIGGEAILRNSIVANSITGGNCSSAITDGGGNLSFPDASCPGIHADPLLGPLQDNGGPTWTMALGPGSAAMDAGDDAICAAAPVNNRDQRGGVRPQGAHCDSGALEQLRRWLPVLIVTSSP